MKWANKQGLAGIDISKKRRELMAAGSTIHNRIESHLKHGDPFPDFERFMEDRKVISCEESISTEWFTGRLDMEMEWKRLRYIVDFKNSANRVYFENRLQLVGYSMAKPCDAFAIVSVPAFEMMTVHIPDRRPYEEILKALSIIYQQKIIANEF